MYNSKVPAETELPSTSQLIKSTVIAATVALALLITVVLPAEYGIDPTGVGSALGLKKMGEIKTSLEAEAQADAAKESKAESSAPAAEQIPAVDAPAAASANSAVKKETATVTLQPDQGAEIKAVMKKGAKIEYKWITSGGKANFDVHADSRALKIKYHNYEKGSEEAKQGTIIAAFDGSHGWFWRNRTKKPLTVSLEVTGDFEELKRVQ